LGTIIDRRCPTIITCRHPTIIIFPVCVDCSTTHGCRIPRDLAVQRSSIAVQLSKIVIRQSSIAVQRSSIAVQRSSIAVQQSILAAKRSSAVQ
jgi:hypothetical protein